MFAHRLRTYTTAGALALAALPTQTSAQEEFKLEEFGSTQISCEFNDDAMRHEIANAVNEALASAQKSGAQGIRTKPTLPEHISDPMLQYLKQNRSIKFDLSANRSNRGFVVICKEVAKPGM